MIKVYFPQGCYGSYVTRCIYNYTNLRVGPFVEFEFDNSGSSHQFRENKYDELFYVLRHGHANCLDMAIGEADYTAVILPCLDHSLDYFNNQLFKQGGGKIVNYLRDSFNEEEFIGNLRSQWGYTGKLDDTIPNWILREWISFWLSNALTNTYNVTEYRQINSTVCFSTQDIFENWIPTLTQAVSSLRLTLTVNVEKIIQQHTTFLEAQKFHNSQIRCEQYVNALFAGHDTKMILNSIFDEAYIQHRLRQHNIEIRCNNLDVFPNTTQQLKALTYETSNHSNP